MERDCESELSKLNIEQNACIYHFGASVIHGQRSNILRLQNIHHYMGMGEKMYALYPIVQTAPESECKNVPDRVNTPETYFLIKNIGCPL